MSDGATGAGAGRPRAYVVSYTHWDREFRFDFETTRMRLVDLMDNLLAILAEKPDFKHFMLDGQFVLLNDYLEIRPEKEAELKRLAGEGRLAVGPWYTLPDSSCVHGESLIRNLMCGLRKSREFGGAMEIGYNVFSFGQIAQLPQIYAGFGIDTIVFYKNMNPNRSRHPEFIWEAPDGTQALATRLGPEARWNFFFSAHVPIVYGLDPWNKDWQYHWGALGKIFHMCEPGNYASFHDIGEPETTFHREKIREGFDRALATVQTTAAPEHLLMFDGTDFTEPHPMIPEIIAAIREEYGDRYDVTHAALGDYVAGINDALICRDLDVVKGEMRDGPIGSVHSDVCSVHPQLKQANSEAENLLFRWAEPFATLAWSLGAEYYLDRAMKYMFGAQAHDSLHGVGPQDMVDDIRNRMLQARVISEAATRRAFQSVANRIDTASADDAELFLVVFNAAGRPRTEVVEAYVDVPRDGRIDELMLEDANGNGAAMHELSRTDTRAGLYHPRSRNMPIYCTRFHLLFEAKDVPALGYKVYKVKTTERSLYPYPHEDWDPLKIPYDSLVTGQRQAENEQVRLDVAPDGTLTITNKATGRTHAGLNYFIDAGEQGNLYFHAPPPTGRIESTVGAPARVSLLVDSPLLARFSVETTMRLPVGFDRAAGKRSRQEVDVPVTSEITLHRGCAAVEITTTVDNRVRDHFLRACFTTGVVSEVAHVDANFNVNAYATRPARDGEFRGQQLTRNRQHMFVDLSDADGGFAVLNDAVRDYEVIDADSGTIALSVVRGVVLRIPCDNRLWMEYPGDDSAQSLGPLTMHYGLYAHAGDWADGGVYPAAVAFNTPMRVAQIGRNDGNLPPTGGLVELRGEGLVLSGVKKAEDRDSVVVRLFNPSDAAVTGELSFGHDVAEAWVVNLNEDRAEPIESATGQTVPVTAGPKKILTVEAILA